MNWIAENIKILKLALKNDEPISLICTNARKKLFFSVDYYVAKRKLSRDEAYNVFLNRIDDEFEKTDWNSNELNKRFRIINITRDSNLKGAISSIYLEEFTIFIYETDELSKYAISELTHHPQQHPNKNIVNFDEDFID